MTSKETIQSLFHLGKFEEEFHEATTPKSCGGTDKFKYLALIGDQILNLGIINYFTKSETFNTGEITIEKNSIHKRGVL